MKFDFGLAGGIGGGFDLGHQLDLLLLQREHGVVGGFQLFGSGFTTDGNVVGDEAQPVEGVDVSVNNFGGNFLGIVDFVHGIHP
jgi:hypothetical protein